MKLTLRAVSPSLPSPLLTFAVSAEGQLSGCVGLRTVPDVQIPHVVFVGGPRLKGLEEPLVPRRVFPRELQAALHTLDAREQLQERKIRGGE